MELRTRSARQDKSPLLHCRPRQNWRTPPHDAQVSPKDLLGLQNPNISAHWRHRFIIKNMNFTFTSCRRRFCNTHTCSPVSPDMITPNISIGNSTSQTHSTQLVLSGAPTSLHATWCCNKLQKPRYRRSQPRGIKASKLYKECPSTRYTNMSTLHSTSENKPVTGDLDSTHHQW